MSNIGVTTLTQLTRVALFSVPEGTLNFGDFFWLKVVGELFGEY
jgi:hypothetical protein